MPYMDAATYQQREAEWRDRAAQEPPGDQRNACVALANGYANLQAILARIDEREAAQRTMAMRYKLFGT